VGGHDDCRRHEAARGRGIASRHVTRFDVHMSKGLRALLVVHGFITMAAGIVLTVAPTLIPSAVGIHLEPSANVLAYLLAGAEFGLAVLSFGGSRLTNSRALRLIVWTFIAFHGSSGVLEVYSYAQGASGAILGNVAARAVIIGLFAYLSRDDPNSDPTDDSEGL